MIFNGNKTHKTKMKNILTNHFSIQNNYLKDLMSQTDTTHTLLKNLNLFFNRGLKYVINILLATNQTYFVTKQCNKQNQSAATSTQQSNVCRNGIDGFC